MRYLFFILMICISSVIFGQTKYNRIKSDEIYTENNQVFTKNHIPLNGHYKIKNANNSRIIEISHFENGFRQGVSKELFKKKVETKGTYIDGLKHGVWKNFSLGITSEYKYGKKNGVEFGKTLYHENYVCTYVNDNIDGFLLKYNSNNVLNSKEFYKRGKIEYIHKYDDSLNIIETSNFFYNDPINLECKKLTNKGISKTDSIFYEKEPLFKNIGTPFKIIKYENQKKILEFEILELKDSLCKQKEDVKFCINYSDKIGEKTKMFFIYNNLLNSYTIPLIKRSIFTSHSLTQFKPEDLYFLLFINGFNKINIYVDFSHTDTLYKVKYYEKNDHNMFSNYSLIKINKLTPISNTY